MEMSFRVFQHDLQTLNLVSASACVLEHSIENAARKPRLRASQDLPDIVSAL
jgi:hypothetical protein